LEELIQVPDITPSDVTNTVERALVKNEIEGFNELRSDVSTDLTLIGLSGCEKRVGIEFP
jgi:hypothetical protein